MREEPSSNHCESRDFWLVFKKLSLYSEGEARVRTSSSTLYCVLTGDHNTHSGSTHRVC